MTLKADILLPVYNAPHLVQNLLESLISNTPPDSVNEIIIGDDGSDPTTQQVLETFKKTSPIPTKIIRHDKNVGFVKNCNQIYKLSPAPFSILLNTDTLLPPGWLERALAPFAKDPSVALATPLSTSAANLTVKIPPGHSWMDLDRVYRSLEANYPDACTAVGFCLAIRKSAIERPELFDEIFGHGYGEETDLHYYLLQQGYRSVVIDNLIIHHSGSASFALLPSLDERKRKNYDLFIRRWGEIHSKKIEEFQKYSPLKNKINFNSQESIWKLEALEYDILFVLPAFNENSGGVQVVVDIVEKLIKSGVRAGILSESIIEESYVEKLHSFTPLAIGDISKIKSTKAVFATLFTTVDLTKKLSKAFNAQVFYLVQGPEAMFSSGEYFGRVIRDYGELQNLVCVSTFLTSYLKTYVNQQASIKNIKHGPDPLVFYPKKVQRKRKSIAGCLRSTPEKGTCYLLEFLFRAKEAGYEISLFGKNQKHFILPEGFATLYGDLSSAEISKLFSEVEFYADFSFFEGLGLLPLEAAFCGAIPIVTKNGGSNFIFDMSNSLLFDGLLDNDRLLAQMEALDTNQLISLSKSAMTLSSSYSSRESLKQFELCISEFIAKPTLPEVLNTKLMVYSNREEPLACLDFPKNSFMFKVVKKLRAIIHIYRYEGLKNLAGKALLFAGRKLINI